MTSTETDRETVDEDQWKQKRKNWDSLETRLTRRPPRIQSDEGCTWFSCAQQKTTGCTVSTSKKTKWLVRWTWDLKIDNLSPGRCIHVVFLGKTLSYLLFLFEVFGFASYISLLRFIFSD